MANDRARTRLYFGHVRESEILNSNSIHKYLSSYGQIVEVKVGYNFFFVEFEEASDADDVLRVFQDTPFMGLQQLAVQFARPMNREMEAKTRGRTRGRLRSPPMRRPAPRFPVTIQGLPRGICWQDLKDFARRERSDPLPVFCDISQNDHNKGFIEYSSLEEAANAVRSLNGRVFHEGRVKATMVKTSAFPQAYSKRRRSASPREHFATNSSGRPQSGHYGNQPLLLPSRKHPRSPPSYY